MDLRAEISNLVAQLSTEPGFLYGRKSEINIQGDDAILLQTVGCVALIEPDQLGFTLDPVTGGLRDNYNTFIQFIIQNDTGEQANYRHPYVQRMRNMAAEFIGLLNDSELFDALNTNIPGYLVVDAYDFNVCGIEINLTQLTDLQPRLC